MGCQGQETGWSRRSSLHEFKGHESRQVSGVKGYQWGSSDINYLRAGRR